MELEIDDIAEEEVLRRGLRRIERTDGGVTKQRYASKCAERAATPGAVQEQAGDGAGSDGSASTFPTGEQQPDTIWVNIFDPIEKPAFKPSPLKPLPWFMQQPNWVNVDTPQEPPMRDSNLHLPLPPRTYIEGSSESASSTTCPSGQKTPVPPRSSSRSPPKASPPATLRSQVLGQNVDRLEELDYFPDVEPLRPLVFRRKPTYINEEPLQRPSSRLSPPRRLSVPRASPCEAPSELHFEEAVAIDQQRAVTEAAPPLKPSSPAASQIASQLHRLMKGSTPTQSTESINLSRKSGASSIAMSRAATEGKTDTTGSTTSLRSVRKTRSKGGSMRRGFGAELRRFFTGK